MSPRYPNFVTYITIPIFLATFIFGVSKLKIFETVPNNSGALMAFSVIVLTAYLLSIGLVLSALESSTDHLGTTAALLTLLLPYTVSSVGFFYILLNFNLHSIACWILTIAYFIFLYTIFDFRR